jgi:hypothetical protein
LAKSQLKLVLYLAGKSESDGEGVMPKDEASVIWNELDPYRYGFVTAGAL